MLEQNLRQLVAQFLDIFLPSEIKKVNRAEELSRARILILFMSVNLMLALVGLLISPIYSKDHSAVFNTRLYMVITSCLVGHMTALLVFKYTGRRVIAANIFAFSYYLTILLGSLLLFEKDSTDIILFLLMLPLLLTIIANFNSGRAWLFMIAVSPVFLKFFGKGDISGVFVANWIALCFGFAVIVRSLYEFINDLSERLNYQCTQLEIAASHDSLTGISNRSAFDLHLKESIDRCRKQGTKTVLIYIDLDKFKPINDNYGHHVGDFVLMTVAERLRNIVRSTDMVARLGGDEFAILFSQCNPDKTQRMIDDIKSTVIEPITVSGKNLNVGCSLGVVICPDDGVDPNQLSRKADSRMYEAKHKSASA